MSMPVAPLGPGDAVSIRVGTYGKERWLLGLAGLGIFRRRILTWIHGRVMRHYYRREVCDAAGQSYDPPRFDYQLPGKPVYVQLDDGPPVLVYSIEGEYEEIR